MVNGCSGMESDEEKKKLNDDLVVFMRKRSETDAPRYTARLKTYVDLRQKFVPFLIFTIHTVLHLNLLVRWP